MTVTIEGDLFVLRSVESGSSSRWRRRYFVLSANTLYEFMSFRSRSSLSVHCMTPLSRSTTSRALPPLEAHLGQVCVSANNVALYPIALDSPSFDDPFVFAATSVRQQLDWIEAIQNSLRDVSPSAIYTGAVKEGFLLRLGSRFRSSAHFFAVVKPGKMHFFRTSLHSEPVSTLSLKDADVQAVSSNLSRPFVLSIRCRSSSSPHKLCAADTPDRDTWIEAISSCIIESSPSCPVSASVSSSMSRCVSVTSSRRVSFSALTNEHQLLQEFQRRGQSLALSGHLHVQSFERLYTSKAFLFSDLLVLTDIGTHSNASKMQRFEEVELGNAHIYRKASHVVEAGACKHAFALVCASETLVLATDSASEHERWISQLSLSIQAAMLTQCPDKCLSYGWTHAAVRDSIHADALLGNLGGLQGRLQDPESVNDRDENGTTALHIACHGGHVSFTQALLEAGANAESRDADFETPLHLAARQGHVDVVSLLCKHMGDRSFIAVNGSNRSTLWIALWGTQRSARDCFKVLVDAGADVDALERVSNLTLLQEAIMRGDDYAWSWRLLLANGANPDAESGAKRTALHYASMVDSVIAASLLLSAGANVTARDEILCTPLHVARSLGVARVLVSQGCAPLNVIDDSGRVAIHAFQHSETDMAALQIASLASAKDNHAKTQNILSRCECPPHIFSSYCRFCGTWVCQRCCGRVPIECGWKDTCCDTCYGQMNKNLRKLCWTRPINQLQEESSPHRRKLFRPHPKRPEEKRPQSSDKFFISGNQDKKLNMCISRSLENRVFGGA